MAAVILLFVTVDPWMPFVGLFMGGSDLDVYRDGARHAVAGLPLYTAPVIHGLLYTYTPFSTLLFVPFGLLPGEIDQYIWMGCSVVLLAAIVALCWRILGYRLTGTVAAVSVLLAGGFVFLEPVRTTLFFGQINLVLMALVLWDTSRGEQSRIKGIGVGIAAGVKLTPAYFVLYYLALRQWRSAAVAVGTIAATIAVSWAVLPQDSWQYWTRTFFDSTRIADDGHPANQSLKGALTRLLDHPAPTWLWLLCAAAVVAASMWVVVRLHRGGERLLAITIAGLSAAVVSPFSWSHHWVWFVPLLVWLIDRALVRAWWWLAVIAILGITGSWSYRSPETGVLVGLYLFPPPSWISGNVLVNLYVVVYLLVLAGAALVAVRCPQPSVPEPLPRPGPVHRSTSGSSTPAAAPSSGRIGSAICFPSGRDVGDTRTPSDNGTGHGDDQ